MENYKVAQLTWNCKRARGQNRSEWSDECSNASNNTGIQVRAGILNMVATVDSGLRSVIRLRVKVVGFSYVVAEE